MKSAENLTTLPRYTFSGSGASDHKLVELLTKHLDSQNYYSEQREKYPQNNIYDKIHTAMTQCILNLGIDLGFDLSERRSDPEKLLVIPHDAYRKFGRGPNSYGFYSSRSREIVVKRLARRHIAGIINHELVHSFSFSRISLDVKIDRNNKFLDIQSDQFGIESHKCFKGINETVTEITNEELIRNYWPNNSHISNDKELSIAMKHHWSAYLHSIILLDEMLKKYYNDPKMQFKQLQKSMLNGDIGAIKDTIEPLEQPTGKYTIIGRGLAKVLKTITGKPSLRTFNPDTDRDSIKIAKSLGLRDAVKKIENKDPGGLLEWL
jgi:hypothetical protein